MGPPQGYSSENRTFPWIGAQEDWSCKCWTVGEVWAFVLLPYPSQKSFLKSQKMEQHKEQEECIFSLTSCGFCVIQNAVTYFLISPHSILRKYRDTQLQYDIHSFRARSFWVRPSQVLQNVNVLRPNLSRTSALHAQSSERPSF